MAALLKEESTITAKGQTTVPKSVRQALGVSFGDRIAFLVDEQRRIYVEKVVAVEDGTDPVLEPFLEFLANDMAKNPDRSVMSFPQALHERVSALVKGMTVDLDEEIDGEVAI